MSRPQKNNANYFPHSTGLRNHRKVKMLKNNFGNVLGYAFWCLMLEWLTEQDSLKWDYSELEIEMFAAELGVSAAEITPMFDFCIRIQLLSKDCEGFVFSQSLNDELRPLFEKRDRERQKFNNSKNRVSDHENTPDEVVSAAEITVSEAETTQSRLDKNRVYKSKEKKKKDISEPSASDGIYPKCMDFYNAFVIDKTGVGAKINSGTGAAMNKIISYLKTQCKNKDNLPEDVPKALQYVLINYPKWDKFHQGQLNLNQIESNLINIINSIKNGKTSSNPTESVFAPK